MFTLYTVESSEMEKLGDTYCFCSLFVFIQGSVVLSVHFIIAIELEKKTHKYIFFVIPGRSNTGDQ